MSYQSVDSIQNAMAQDVFGNRQDVKKAAGRALGTVVELITFYILREWKFAPALTIELALPEFGNQEITHNVEFGLHPIISRSTLTLPSDTLPITAKKIARLSNQSHLNVKSNTLFTRDGLMRNSCLLWMESSNFVVANIQSKCEEFFKIDITQLSPQPFAMVECKRVGVEEGAKKGPTTIEKAKQGAYVAKHVSSLQKIRSFDGRLYGALAKPDGTFELKPWEEELRRLIYDASAPDLSGFILTVGLVSNHGNWFTSDDPNKELKVLKQSYDWLLFLNDNGIAEFVTDTILSNRPEMAAIRKAFRDSYVSGQSGSNRFTKVKIDYEAHIVLDRYFNQKISHIEHKWLSVLTPRNEKVSTLKEELKILRDKKWQQDR